MEDFFPFLPESIPLVGKKFTHSGGTDPLRRGGYRFWRERSGLSGSAKKPRPVEQQKRSRTGVHPFIKKIHTSGLQIRKEFFRKIKESRDSAEAHVGYTAQGIFQIDAEIAEKGHFRMETN
jgi:hypothetical protein